MRLFALASLLALTGCATTGLSVVYHSDPEGATIYQDGAPVGVTPARLNYVPNASFTGGGCQQLRGLTAKWVSGAQASITSLNACANVGRQQTYTFVRPDIPGRDVDAMYALELQRNAILRQQAQAANSAAAAQWLRATQPQYRPPAFVNCNSYQMGTVVQTTCH